MPRLLISNELGETQIISKGSLQKLEKDFAWFKEMIMSDRSMTDTHRRELEAHWTIKTVKEIE